MQFKTCKGVLKPDCIFGGHICLQLERKNLICILALTNLYWVAFLPLNPFHIHAKLLGINASCHVFYQKRFGQTRKAFLKTFFAGSFCILGARFLPLLPRLVSNINAKCLASNMSLISMSFLKEEVESKLVFSCQGLQACLFMEHFSSSQAHLF